MKIIIFGKLPPPNGGVTKSIQSLYKALKLKNVEVSIVSAKTLFKRYDIAHIHYSKGWKRLLGLIIGKIIAKKVIFTLHGNKYFNSISNRLNMKLSDGVVFLNQTVYKKYKKRFKKSIVLTSIFKESIYVKKNDLKILNASTEKKYILVYAYNKIYQDGKDIYGIDFILKNINRITKEFIIVLLDPNKGYQEDIKKISNTNLVYIDKEINFITLLSEIDIYLRPTSTDGNSVAVQEALLLNKIVIASNVIDRGECVITYQYNNIDDLLLKLKSKQNNKKYIPDSITKYIDFIKGL